MQQRLAVSFPRIYELEDRFCRQDGSQGEDKHGSMEVDEARRTQTVAMTALGCLGERAVAQGNAPLCSLLAHEFVRCVNGVK